MKSKITSCLFMLTGLILLSFCNNKSGQIASTDTLSQNNTYANISVDNNSLIHPLYIDNVIEINEGSTLNISFCVEDEYVNSKYTLELLNIDTDKSICIFSAKDISKKIETSVTINESGQYLLFIVSQYANIPENAYELNYSIQEAAALDENTQL